MVFLTAVNDAMLCAQAMKRGAVDFLLKPIDSTQLLEAVNRALELDAQNHLNQLSHRLMQLRVDSLTPKQRLVMSQVMLGRLNKQIADELEICEKTVKVHRARVMTKMRVRSVAELVYLGTRFGILSDAPQMIGVTGIVAHSLAGPRLSDVQSPIKDRATRIDEHALFS
jgi:FixJ family two-component response regulator